jgi:predicted nucleic-acid-binding protein
MKGVQFVVDEHGTKTAVVINLKQYSELWEDFYDCAVAQDRKNEPRESLASVKKRLMTRGKTRSHG